MVKDTSMHWMLYIAEVFSLWSADPWGSVEGCQGVREQVTKMLRSVSRGLHLISPQWQSTCCKQKSAIWAAEHGHCFPCPSAPTPCSWLGSSSRLDWIRNPFECVLTDSTGREQKQLAELSSDRSLRLQFNSMALISVCIRRSCEYPLLSEKAVNVLLPCATTYLCETAFSAVTAMTTKYRSRLNIEHDIRDCLARISPRLDKLCGAKQAQPSHWTVQVLYKLRLQDSYWFLTVSIRFSIISTKCDIHVQWVIYQYFAFWTWGSAAWKKYF